MTDIQKAKLCLQNSSASCVVVKDTNTVQSDLPGIMPLLGWLEKSPNTLQNSAVADKVVGKAAALLMVLGNVSAVYAEVISASAEEYLQKNQIPFTYGEKVPHILNRGQTDLCPMEKRCLELDSPSEAYEILKEMVQARK